MQGFCEYNSGTCKQQRPERFEMCSNICCQQKRSNFAYKKHQELPFKCHDLTFSNNFFGFNSFSKSF